MHNVEKFNSCSLNPKKTYFFQQNFTVRSLDLFTRFLFTEILELVDLDWKGPGGPENCNRFHLMPRFSRSLPGKSVQETDICLLNAGYWRDELIQKVRC